MDELYFQTLGLVDQVDQLKGLYELFAEVLNQLTAIGSAYDHAPRPGGA